VNLALVFSRGQLMLSDLVAQLRQSVSLLSKQDIQTAARFLGESAGLLGDDCAAIADGDGYLLLATEGMLPAFVETDPWFAGWSAVMVNVSDIYAMGGQPIAIVDALWSPSARSSELIWQGMQAAAQAYHVPIVGGHTNIHSPYNALAVAILGRAKQLITSFNARPGDLLLMAIDLRGKPHPQYPFWNAATEANPVQLRQNLGILTDLAINGLCDAGKDISNGGLIGTLLMLLETSNCGAVLDLDQIPSPPGLSLERWLISFPSYGFVLSVRPNKAAAVQACFKQQSLACAVVGEVQSNPQLVLHRHCLKTEQLESALFWDLSQQSLTGFSKAG
jgi:uncharacterized protein